MQRSTALGCGEVLVLGVSVSDPVYWCRAVDYSCTAGERDHCTSARQAGEVCSPLCLGWVAIAMPGSEPV